MATKKIRVHNQGKREYIIPPSKKGGKNRMLQPGRAIEIEKDLALKLIDDYPRDLIEFDSLISGEKKNINKENIRLESENEDLTKKNGQLKQDNQDLKDTNSESETKLREENQKLKDKLAEIQKDPAGKTDGKKESGQDNKR